MDSVKCFFYNVFLIVALFFLRIFVVVMKVLEWTANRICACGRWVFVFLKTNTATKQRTKQTINVNIQGNDTETVMSKSPESCRVKTTSLLKNKKPFKEKEISTKEVRNSVRFPDRFISNNQKRSDEERVTRNHASRRTGQVATGITNSLRTLYFDFQNKDENNYKLEKRNERIKDGVKLRPNQYGGHIERKIFVPKTVLNSIGNYRGLDFYDQNKNTSCDLTDHYKQLNQIQMTKPQGNQSPTSILKTRSVRLWSVDVNADTKNPAIYQRQDCGNSNETGEYPPETGTKILNNNTVQQENCENSTGKNKVLFNSTLMAASKTMTNFVHDATKSICIYSSWQVERNQKIRKVSLILMDMANVVVNIVRNGCFRFVNAQVRNIKNSRKMLARNSMIVVSATRSAILDTIRGQTTLTHSIQSHGKVITEVMTRVLCKTGRVICSPFTSGVRVLRSAVATSTSHIHEVVSQLITNKSAKEGNTSPQMTSALSIITKVQQDNKSTDNNVAHQLQSSTAPKDDQKYIGNLSTVRAGGISSTSEHVRYSEYSNKKKNPIIKPGSQRNSKDLYSHTNESLQSNNNKQNSRSAGKKVQMSTSSSTGQRLYLPELKKKHSKKSSKGKLKDCEPLLSMLPSSGDESSKVAVNRTKKQKEVISANCEDTPIRVISATCADTPSSTLSATCTDKPVPVISAICTDTPTSGVISSACADTPALTPTVTCEPKEKPIPRIIPPSQVNTVANSKDIRTTLSSVNANAESEVIRPSNSVNRHSVEIQNAEDLPFARGKRPHFEKERTSVDGQTPASFISQFKFNTAVPNTTTGIKEPHPLELRNTKFTALSSAGENIFGSDTGSSFKNVQTRLQPILSTSHLVQGGTVTQPEPMEVGEIVEKPFRIPKPEAMEVSYGPCPMIGDSSFVQVPITNSAEKQEIEEMETEQEHSSVWSFFPFSLPSFPASPFRIPSAVEEMELDEQSVHVTELEKMEVSEEVFPMTTPFGQNEKAKWSALATGMERSVTCPLPQQVKLGFRPFVSPYGEIADTKRPLASRMGVFGESAFSLKTASAEQRIMQPGTLQQVPFASTPSVMQPSVMQQLNAQTAMQPADPAAMQSKVQAVTQPVVMSTTQSLTQQMSQPVIQSYMFPVVQAVSQTEAQPKPQQVAQLAKQLPPQPNTHRLLRPINETETLRKSQQSLIYSSEETQLDKDTSEQPLADRELTSTPEELLADLLEINESETNSRSRRDQLSMDEQLQLVPSIDAAYLDTVSDSESEFDSDDEFELDLETIEKFSYLESSPDHARLITKIMNEKESTQWHSVSDLHSNGNNLADKHGLSETLDLNVIERYSELEDEIERSPEYADHLAKLLAEKESLSELCHM